MSDISVWAISIAGVALLSVLVDIVLPQGKTSKFVKSAMSLICLCVIIQPLLNIYRQKNTEIIDIDYQSDSVYVQKDLEFYYVESQYKLIANNLEQSLANKGICEAQVSFCLQKDYSIAYVAIDLTKVVIQRKDIHINIIEEVMLEIKNNMHLSEEQILIYELR